MKLSVVWQKPVILRNSPNSGCGYLVDLRKIKNIPGVYVFARRHNNQYEALYVGRTKTLRNRINQHTNNLALMDHIKSAKNGARVVVFGIPKTAQGQQMGKVLATLERALIRHFLSEGHDLLNEKGTRIERDEIKSTGKIPKSFVPSEMFVAKK
jgi:hypothetical protein